MAFHEFGFEVEEVEVTGGARHEELNNPFGFGRSVNNAGERSFGASRRGERVFTGEELSEGDSAKPTAGIP